MLPRAEGKECSSTNEGMSSVGSNETENESAVARINA